MLFHYSSGRRQDYPKEPVPIGALAAQHFLTGRWERFSTYIMAAQQGIPTGDYRERFKDLERQLLEQLARWLDDQPDAILLGWDMEKFDGFEGLAVRATRYGLAFPKVSPERIFDLSVWCDRTYGPGYVSHPRLPTLVRLNAVMGQAWLSEEAAAAAWRDGHYASLQRSLEAKVGALAGLYRLALANKLKVERMLLGGDGASAEVQRGPSRRQSSSIGCSPEHGHETVGPPSEQPLSAGEAVDWSRPESVQVWARVFGVRRNTMTRRLKAQTPRNRKSGKDYMVALDDLPAEERDKHRKPRRG
jgi:hypothetical protein